MFCKRNLTPPRARKAEPGRQLSISYTVAAVAFAVFLSALGATSAFADDSVSRYTLNPAAQKVIQDYNKSVDQKAAQETVLDFKQSSHDLIKNLRSQDFSAIGQFNLDDFDGFVDSESVNVAPFGFDFSEKTAGCGTAFRGTAEWVSDLYGTAISINTLVWPKATIDAKQVVSIHENIGVKKIDDHDCQISCGMLLLSKPDTKKILTAEEYSKLLDQVARDTYVELKDPSPKKKQPLIRVADGGGITGIGGGDWRVFQAKLQRLQGDLDQISHAKNRQAAVLKLLKDLHREFEMIKPVASDVRTLSPPEAKEHQKLCEILQYLSPEVKLRVFESLHANVRNLPAKVSTVDGMVKFCTEFAKSQHSDFR